MALQQLVIPHYRPIDAIDAWCYGDYAGRQRMADVARCAIVMEARQELNKLLQISGVTTGRIGREVGLSQQAVSSMATGRLRVSEEVLQGARVVGCTVIREGFDILRESFRDRIAGERSSTSGTGGD